METSLFPAALQGFLNLLHFKVFLAMLVGSSGLFTVPEIIDLASIARGRFLISLPCGTKCITDVKGLH
jgi:hypothetical protein